jgi:PAS domain S-box-containing protein
MSLRQGTYPPPPPAQAATCQADVLAMAPMHPARTAGPVLAALQDGIVVLDTELRVLEVNPAMCAMSGYTAEEWIGGLPPYPIWPCEAEELLRGLIAEAVRNGSGRYEAEFERRGGERFPAVVDVCPVGVPGEPHCGVVCVVRDVTEDRRAHEAVRMQARVLDEIGAAFVATDLHGSITHWSGGSESLYGWRRDEAVGRPLTALGLVPLHAESSAALLGAMASQTPWQGEQLIPRKDGATVPVDVHVVPLDDAEGRTVGFIGIGIDVSDRVSAEASLRTARDRLRAVTDSMAEGLYTLDAAGRFTYANRAAERLLGWTTAELEGRDMHATVHFRREDGSAFPAAECELLGVRQTGSVRRMDEDVFIRKDGTALPVSYTASPLDGQDGRGAVVVFSDASDRRDARLRQESQLEALDWINRIHGALADDRFVLYAQPIIDLESGATVQHELLIRMLDEAGRLVAPGLFLPVAEEYGLIREIDRWVIRQAVALAAAGHPLEVNLSAESLGDPSLLGYVEQELTRTGADPAKLVFELTETALLRDEDAACSFIEGVDRLGSHVALDDFGTGYGGFTYLKRLPIDYLKIDIEFVRDLPHNLASRHVVRAVVSLARDFGLRTVAEGVEDDQTLALLREHGVDFAQGFGIGRPAPVADVLHD